MGTPRTAGRYPMSRRNALARERGFSSYAQQRRFGSVVRGRADLAALPPGARDARQRALDALAVARRGGLSLADAARREGSSVDSLRWWLGDAVTRSGRGWAPTTSDRLFRPMYVYSAGRAVPVDVRGSRVASVVGAYHAAVRRYLSTGDDSSLAKFAGKRVGGVELETDLDVIDELARRGEFDFESIYRMVD